MEWLFGRRMTPDEMLRKNQRALNKAMRELDRERAKMEQQEKKIINDIKKMAKQGQMDAVKIMAKVNFGPIFFKIMSQFSPNLIDFPQDLVRTRRYVKKFMLMRANIQAVSLKIQTLKSQNAMAQAMKGVTKAMGNMNKQMKLPEIQKIMMEFEKQSEIMDMKGEMMEDAIGKFFKYLNHYQENSILNLSQMTSWVTKMTKKNPMPLSIKSWMSLAFN